MESFKGEKQYHAERMTALTAESTRLKTWLDRAYTDRLEGILTTEEYRPKADVWRLRLADIQNEMRAHQSADANYLEDAHHILDLAQRAHDLYLAAGDNFVRRQIVDQVVSKVAIFERRAVLNLAEPFQTLAKLAIAARSRKGRSLRYAQEDLNL